MTKRKVQQPVKTGQIAQNKMEAAVKKVLNAPGSSKAAKTSKGTALSSKPKAPTLKEQVNNWKELYAILSDDYLNLVHKLSEKDSEIVSLRSALDVHRHDLGDYQILKERYAILENTYFDLLERHNTPWYTKLLNFFKGD